MPGFKIHFFVIFVFVYAKLTFLQSSVRTLFASVELWNSLGVSSSFCQIFSKVIFFLKKSLFRNACDERTHILLFVLSVHFALFNLALVNWSRVSNYYFIFVLNYCKILDKMIFIYFCDMFFHRHWIICSAKHINFKCPLIYMSKCNKIKL